MLAGRQELLQVYAKWLCDPRSNQVIALSSASPILIRLSTVPLNEDTDEVFIDARKEDALLALTLILKTTFVEDLWLVLFNYAKCYHKWRTLHDNEELLEQLSSVLFLRVPETTRHDFVMLIMHNIGGMEKSKSCLSFVFSMMKRALDTFIDHELHVLFTNEVLKWLVSEEQVNYKSIFHSQSTVNATILLIKTLKIDADSENIFDALTRLSEAIYNIVKLKSDPVPQYLELFVECTNKCVKYIEQSSKTNMDLSFVKKIPTEMAAFNSATVYGQVLCPVIDMIALTSSSESALSMLHSIRSTINHLSQMNLTESPEYEQTAKLFGNILGKLMTKCLEADRPSVISFIKSLQISIPESPKPSDTVTGGFHLSCPTALPIFGAVCEQVNDVDLATHCFSIVNKCFQKGPFGQRARIFYDQMIAMSAGTRGTSILNSTLDVFCRIYLEMEGLDGNSAALATAFEDLVSSCAEDRVKRELVTLSLLGLLVQKGVKMAEDKVSRSASTQFLGQPPAALLELLLPAVALGMSRLEKVESISRQAFVELVQEFWFVAIFHAYQPSLNWPESWTKHLSVIAVHSPVLIKERDRADGNTAKVILTQPLSNEFKNHLGSLMPNCANRVFSDLGTAQCLWLLAFHQSESMRVVKTDKFDSVVQYITDDIVADLGLSDFVNDLSIGIVKQWLDKTGRKNPHLLIDLTTSMVDLLGSIYDRIHDAGISLLRFILSQDEQLMAEEAVWRSLFSRLRLLSALKCHEPGCALSAEYKSFAGREYITDSGYARRVFEDALAFFRSVSAAAVKLSPDVWHEWALERIREMNDPMSGADLDYLFDDIIRSLLLDRQQPKRNSEGPSLDGCRQLVHHLDWALDRCTLDIERLIEETKDTEGMKVAITVSLNDLKKCRILTDSWSTIVRRHPNKLFPIIAELGDILKGTFIQNDHNAPLSCNIFMHKITMGPSAEMPMESLPVKALCLENILSFLIIQLGRQTFTDPSCVSLFSLVGEVMLEVGLCWPMGHGRRLIVQAIANYSLKTLLQLQRIHPDSPKTSLFRNRLFLYLQHYYEQPVDWHIESQRVLQLESEHLRSTIFSLKRVVNKSTPRRISEVCQLFLAFTKHDLLRMSTVMNRKPGVDDAILIDLKKYLELAVSISVPLAIQLDNRLAKRSSYEEPTILKEQLTKALIKNPWLMFTRHQTPVIIETVLQCQVDPGDQMVGRAIFPPGLLHFLPPCPPLTALALFRSPTYQECPRWLNYAMRSLESFPPEQLFFYTPQITQAVRKDHLGYIEATILHIARTSSKLAHQIIWNMKANMYIDDLGTVEDPMKAKLEELVGKIVNGLRDVPFYKREFDFFERVTGISGTLKAFIKKEKWEKKKKIDEELRKIPVDPGVYLPSNPESTVIDIDYDSGRPLQSQAKAPFMATFRVKDAQSKEGWQSAIFKVGDDCRQDVLALQFVAAVKMILEASGLNAYLFPYRVIATAPGCGVIEVIPNSQSRDQLGREKINSLYGYFTFKFGGDRTVRFGQARDALVRSMAAYSVVCYLLAIRDRHNGNIMIEEQGHLIHIDFGFILDIAPGGVKFETAPFKFTSEMLQVLGGRESAAFAWFQELCVQCFLAVRPYGPQLCRLVEQMSESGLPCFVGNPEKAIRNLRQRFRLELGEWEARQLMEELVYQSCESVTTVLYDSYQHQKNGIPY